MYKGTLWLDYSDEEEEAQYKADISRFIMRDNNVAFDFHGHDIDDGGYIGTCKAVKQGNEYKGDGEFRYRDGTTRKAKIFFKIENDGNELFLSGQWKDENEAFSYQLEAELMEADEKKS